ncbi:apolipoprotein N-acyltransferase [Rickettsiella endosymbiont of Dermanyssus gallinae]|uniref:apolipoprotein N-acyltransferase n=1 Tax=Rickettsiella endosymbiont of Dermanyssus gallinae TaxID=2856608 RepID=UPI001C52C55B|nr:apolipoprotein N-acyltransferase [Rickettsiella endosymbiont of Dermanyssus gallinae]
MIHEDGELSGNAAKNSSAKNIYFKEGLALIIGGLLALAFAPLALYPLAIICPALLLLLWLNCTPRRSFFIGLFFGIGFFSVGVSWVFISIHVFGNTSILLSLFITGLFIFILALFTGLQGYFLNRFFPDNSRIKRYLIFPSLWTLSEWVRSWILTGFPWLLLSTSQVNSPLAGYVPLIGGLGVTFLVTLSSALLSGVIIEKEKNSLYSSRLNFRLCSRPVRNPHVPDIHSGSSPSRRLAENPIAVSLFPLVLLIVLWIAGYGLHFIHWTRVVGQPIQVSLIQANIPQEIKWEPQYAQTSLDNYKQLTQAYWHSRLIIWPEAAIPILQHNARPFLTQLDKEATQHGATLITGIPIQEGFQYYNGMLAVGVDHARYYKQRLVIFGEYLPWWIACAQGLLNLLDIPMSSFSPGPPNQSAFKVAGVDLGTFICYEIAYPSLVREALPKAQLLLTINDDAWFGHSFALAQHLQIGQFQALATGRYLLFLSNTGMTAIVTPQGNIQAQLPPFKVSTLTGSVYALSGTTPWVKLGDCPSIMFLVGLIILCYAYTLRT